MVNYADGITVITPTGDRWKALKRCKFYMERQTIKPDQWLITDDGKEKTANKLVTTLNPTIIERVPSQNRAKSFTGNILAFIDRS